MKKRRKVFAIAVVLAMLISLTLPVHAVTLFTLEQDPESFTEHDVYLNGEKIVVYCLQKDYVWPKSEGSTSGDPTKYYEASLEQYLLTPDQIAIMKQVMFGGYPYNDAGCLNEFYITHADFPKLADWYAAEVTQCVLWALLMDWGVEGNVPGEFDLSEEMVGPFNALMEFATNGAKLEKPQSSQATIVGDTKFVEDSEGNWKSGALSIAGPENYKVLFQLTLPENVYATDSQGNVVTQIAEGDTFYLNAEKTAEFTSDITISVSADVRYPGDITHYMTDDKSAASSEEEEGVVYVPYQTMLSLRINTITLSGTATLSPVSQPDPTEPDPTEPDPTEPDPTVPDPTVPDPTEPDPTEPDPTEPDPTEPEPAEPDNPKTGDNSLVASSVLLLALTLFSMVLMLFRKRTLQ